MTYAQNDTDAVKNFYEVHLRSTKTFEDPKTENQLKALANDFEGFTVVVLTKDSIDAAFNTPNAYYSFDGTGQIATKAFILTLGNLGGSPGDVIIFEFNLDVGQNVTIQDENALVTTLTNANDIIVFKLVDAAPDKWTYYFMAHHGDTLNQELFFTEIGILDEGPSITTEKNDTRMTSKGYDLFTKKIVLETNDLQVNEANSDYYRSITSAGHVDIMFYEPNNTEHSYFFLNFPLENYLNIKGNSWNTIPLIGMKETSLANLSSYLKLF